MPIVLLVFWAILLAGTFLTALWNALEARKLRELRQLEAEALTEIQSVINHNADTTIQLLNYVHSIAGDVTKLNARSEIYDLAFKIKATYPDPEKIEDISVLKLDEDLMI